MVKRIFPILSAFILLFNVISQPVYASEVVNDYIENSFAIYPYLTDENGYITSDEMNMPQTLALGEGIAMGAAGATGSLSPGPFMVYLILILAGCAWNTLTGLINESQRIFNKLDEDNQQYLINCYATGGDSFVITQALAEDFLRAYGEVYAEEDGTLKTEGFSFSVSSLLQYDYSSQRVYGDTLTTPIYTLPLSTSPVSIPGTTLTINKTYYFNDISGRDNPYGFYITNTSTGVSATFVPFGINDEKECATVSLSVPVIQAYQSYTSDFVYHVIGFWSMETCSIRGEGTGVMTCSLHRSAKYESEYLADFTNPNPYAAITFENTGTDIDGKLINGWNFRVADDTNYDTDCIEWSFADEDTPSYISDMTPLAYLMSAPAYTVSHTGDADEFVVPGATVHQPVTDVSTNANAVTRSEVMTGVASSPAVPDTGTDVSGILGWLSSIWTAIQDVISVIRQGIADVAAKVLALPQAIAVAISDVLEYLFYPDLSELDSLIGLYKDKFGWVRDVYNFFKNFINRLLWNEPPRIPINLGDAEGNYNWGGTEYVLDMSWYARYKSSGDTIISGIAWVYFLWALFRRIPDILSGIGMYEENRTLSPGHVWLSRMESVREKFERAEYRAEVKERFNKTKGGKGG